jgi:hypothetical protein
MMEGFVIPWNYPTTKSNHQWRGRTVVETVVKHLLGIEDAIPRGQKPGKGSEIVMIHPGTRHDIIER